MATERLIIGLYSPAQQSGKSTVAGILAKDFGFHRGHFASALKTMATSLLSSAGLPDREVYELATVRKEEPIPEVGGRSFRYLAQTIGTDWGRELIGETLWVDLLLKNRKRPDLLVVDDVRFPNEYEAIRAEGGQVWRVFRPGAEPTNDHPSEGLLEGFEFDEHIQNTGSISYLRKVVHHALIGPGI